MQQATIREFPPFEHGDLLVERDGWKARANTKGRKLGVEIVDPIGRIHGPWNADSFFVDYMGEPVPRGQGLCVSIGGTHPEYNGCPGEVCDAIRDALARH